MSTLKLNGSTSGYVELTAPASAGNNTITLPTTAGSVVVANASGNVTVGTGVTIYGNSGIVSATSFYGSGANLTGISASGTTGNFTVTNGNVVVSSGYGIDFSAAGNAAGMTNELLNDYEEGTFTPTASNFTVSGSSTLTGVYTKIGRMVYVSIKFENTGTIAHSTSAFITLPFALVFGSVPSGFIAMNVGSNGESFTSGKSGTQCTMDTEGSSRFFVGSFTTTSAGQSLFFNGFYRV